MKIIISSKDNAAYNLTLEEVLLKDPSIIGDVLLIYVNQKTIIFGRNQNVHEEINSNFVKEHKIPLFRRISGGGAVYQDPGNINFSFITDSGPGNYQKFLEPIIAFLQSLGLDAKFKGKNDLVINDLKISGNAQYKFKNRMFHHGTLLFDADFTMLGQALKPNPLKLQSKAIKSAAQRVANIKGLLKEPMTGEEFTTKLVDYFLQQPGSQMMDVSDYKQQEIAAMVLEKTSDAWTYGKNPEFKISNELRFDGGTVKFQANVEENKIKDINFSGDFLSSNDFEQVYDLFHNQDFTLTNVTKVIDSIDSFSDYFGKVTKSELVSLIFPTAV